MVMIVKKPEKETHGFVSVTPVTNLRITVTNLYVDIRV